MSRVKDCKRKNCGEEKEGKLLKLMTVGKTVQVQRLNGPKKTQKLVQGTPIPAWAERDAGGGLVPGRAEKDGEGENGIANLTT